MSLSIDAARRRVRLDPRDPDFFNDPYRAYAAIREAAPVVLLGGLRVLVLRPLRRRLGAVARPPLRPEGRSSPSRGM